MMTRNPRLAVVPMIVVALGILAVAQGPRQDDRRPQSAAGRPDPADRRGDGASDWTARAPQTAASNLGSVLPPEPNSRGVTRALAVDGRALREWDDSTVERERVRELRLRSRQADTLMPGRVHERFDQYYRGVPVFGGETVRETDGNIALSVTAAIYTGLGLDTTPALSPADAVRVFVRETGADPGTNASPQLMVLPRPDGTYALTYRVTAVVHTSLPVVFVNARTGVVEMQYHNLQTQKATALLGNGVLVSQNLVASDLKKVSCTLQDSTYLASDLMRPISIKTYDLKGNVSRADAIIAGRTPFATSDLATNSGTTWVDAVVVDGHTYIGWTYDYFYQRDGWKGFDGNNVRTVSVIVHPAYRKDMTSYVWANVDDYYANAFFCGQCGAGREDLLMFGEGLPAGYYIVSTGQYLDYFVAAPDIVAHEYAHGVTAYTSNLIYRNESGALSEAFCDVMGISVKFFQNRREVACCRLTTRRAKRPPGPQGPAVATGLGRRQPGYEWRPGPLLQALSRAGRQRRRAHELHDCLARLLPRDRGRQERDVRTVGHRCRRGEPGQGREGVLQGFHHPDRERDVQPGEGEDHPGGPRPLRDRQRGRDGHHPGMERRRRVLGGSG